MCTLGLAVSTTPPSLVTVSVGGTASTNTLSLLHGGVAGPVGGGDGDGRGAVRQVDAHGVGAARVRRAAGLQGAAAHGDRGVGLGGAAEGGGRRVDAAFVRGAVQVQGGHPRVHREAPALGHVVPEQVGAGGAEGHGVRSVCEVWGAEHQLIAVAPRVPGDVAAVQRDDHALQPAQAVHVQNDGGRTALHPGIRSGRDGRHAWRRHHLPGDHGREGAAERHEREGPATATAFPLVAVIGVLGHFASFSDGDCPNHTLRYRQEPCHPALLAVGAGWGRKRRPGA